MSGNNFELPETMRINGLADTKDLLNPFIEDGKDLELDASNLQSLDTSGLQLIIAAGCALKKKGATLTITNASDALSKAIDVAGAEEHLCLS